MAAVSVPAAFDPRSRASYSAWVSIPIRFADQDLMGHVNNAAIAIYFEHARCTHILPILAGAKSPGLDIVLARIEIDYLREIRFPGSVDVGIRLVHMGNRSFRVTGAVFDGDTCAAVSDATIVFFDTARRTSAAPTEALRTGLGRLA